MKALASHVLARCRAEPAVISLAITLVTLALAAALVPGLINITTLLMCSFLLVLLLQRLRSEPRGQASVLLQKPQKSMIGRWRLFLFLFLEACVLLGIWFLRRAAAGALPGFAFAAPSIVLAAARYAVLLPPLVLLSWPAWLRVARVYRAEYLAAVIALLTFYPYRFFVALWPHYSQVLGHSVYFLARPFVSTLQYVPDLTPTLVGPALDTTILFACSGLQAIKLFQILFAFVLIVEWNVLDRRRALLVYGAGLATALVTNAVRIALLVVLGNRLSPDLAIRFHVDAGWMFFVVVFSACLWLSYGWLHGSSKSDTASPEHGQFQIASGPAK